MHFIFFLELEKTIFLWACFMEQTEVLGYTGIGKQGSCTVAHWNSGPGLFTEHEQWRQKPKGFLCLNFMMWSLAPSFPVLVSEVESKVFMQIVFDRL